MEFLVVSANKLKIMLNNSEMKELGLDKEELDYSDASVRSSIWRSNASDKKTFKRVSRAVEA